MNFDLTEEQQMLQDSAARYVQRSYPFELRRARANDEGGFRRETWQAIAEMGWLGVAVPEQYGGLGFSPVETGLVAEQLGRALVLEPFVACGVFPAALLVRAGEGGEGGEGGQRAALLEELISGQALFAVAHSERQARGTLASVKTRATNSGDGWRIDGHKTLVVGAPVADKLLVVARTAGADQDPQGLTLFLVDPRGPGVGVVPTRLLDGTPAADIVFDGACLDGSAVVGTVGGALSVLQAAVDEAIVAFNAELVGGMEDTIALCADYLKTRKQFGVAIGSFQALQHRMADMAIELSQARATLHRGWAALTQGGAAQGVTVSGCKAQLIRSARFVTTQGIQLHGGYGITDEYKVGHHYRRLLMLDAQFGNMEFHLKRYACHIQDEARAAMSGRCADTAAKNLSLTLAKD
ncbi:acyl-CoA dehydrogenase [Herbaspirillum rubrisubalbicans]|uniref:Acyl-CoA dehydrogenase n=2 Tax=Pseudomonadati TaxID=3379134 RepID=A0ABX9C7D1_9BURK|nr:acyl-CoA dehydrogenase [Herbaspirillum rubrisubalbicans]RAM66821.1 acyl-CoA dehydrogenase [Herbaspirillum rubrisubalbicans]RAN47480.1 acyl-CoA dehydrogenase [Herbaspirillum rubrisubalbicans]